jgi:hypothetical protein
MGYVTIRSARLPLRDACRRGRLHLMRETRVAGYDSQKRASGIEEVSFRSGWMLLLGLTLKHYSHRQKLKTYLMRKSLHVDACLLAMRC